jgi:hypothetical protein
MQRVRRTFLAITAVIAVLALVSRIRPVRRTLDRLRETVGGGYSVAERLEQFGPGVEERLKPTFAAAGLAYPPSDLAFLAFKDRKVLEVYARRADRPWRLLRIYPVLAASGKPGPKLREGDHQVPEGVYRVEALNPNSRFHLSVRLNYPNEFDRRMAALDGRTNLGGDIMIHGSAVSVGCLAIGDEAAEDLFVLSALASVDKVKVVVSPTDFRTGMPMQLAQDPHWVGELYATLREELLAFRKDA